MNRASFPRWIIAFVLLASSAFAASENPYHGWPVTKLDSLIAKAPDECLVIPLKKSDGFQPTIGISIDTDYENLRDFVRSFEADMKAIAGGDPFYDGGTFKELREFEADFEVRENRWRLRAIKVGEKIYKIIGEIKKAASGSENEALNAEIEAFQASEDPLLAVNPYYGWQVTRLDEILTASEGGFWLPIEKDASLFIRGEIGPRTLQRAIKDLHEDIDLQSAGLWKLISESTKGDFEYTLEYTKASRSGEGHSYLRLFQVGDMTYVISGWALLDQWKTAGQKLRQHVDSFIAPPPPPPPLSKGADSFAVRDIWDAVRVAATGGDAKGKIKLNVQILPEAGSLTVASVIPKGGPLRIERTGCLVPKSGLPLRLLGYLEPAELNSGDAFQMLDGWELASGEVHDFPADKEALLVFAGSPAAVDEKVKKEDHTFAPDSPLVLDGNSTFLAFAAASSREQQRCATKEMGDHYRLPKYLIPSTIFRFVTKAKRKAQGTEEEAGAKISEGFEYGSPAMYTALSCTENLLTRARAKERKGDLDGAIEDYGRCIGVHDYPPTLHTAYSERGRVKALKGDFAGGLADIDLLLEKHNQREKEFQLDDRRLGSLYLLKGKIKQAKGDTQGAGFDYERAVKLDPALKADLQPKAKAMPSGTPIPKKK